MTTYQDKTSRATASGLWGEGDKNRPPPVRIRNLQHFFGEGDLKKQVLFDNSLEVLPGEIVMMTGPSGSGKTTLFRILATLLTPTSGIAQILGMDVSTASHSVRGSIGVVFQKHSLDQKLTVFENLVCYGHLYAMRGRHLKKQAEEVLARFDLADRTAERVETLSEGLKRRVELAKAFLHRPRVLILDEPTVGLDPRARLEFWKGLEAIILSESVIILVTTH